MCNNKINRMRKERSVIQFITVGSCPKGHCEPVIHTVRRSSHAVHSPCCGVSGRAAGEAQVGEVGVGLIPEALGKARVVVGERVCAISPSSKWPILRL